MASSEDGESYGPPTTDTTPKLPESIIQRIQGRFRCVKVQFRGFASFHSSPTDRDEDRPRLGFLSRPGTPVKFLNKPQLPPDVAPLQAPTFDGSISQSQSRKGSRSIIYERSQSPVRLDPHSRSDTGYQYPHDSLDIKFDVKTLLWLSDTVRVSISARNASRSFGTASDSLLLFIERAMEEETDGAGEIDFLTLKQAHLDKLVEEMIEFGRSGAATEARELHYATQAERLQRIWRVRYKVQYFMIDEIRTIDMLTTGRLRNVHFVVENKEGEDTVWWLNIACAYRDGMVATDLEKPTIRDHDERTSLPLLTGREEVLTDHSVKYIRIGKLGDVHHSLFNKTGRRIHVLRGYKLDSDLAPSEGVRYDGLWTLRNLSHKLDNNTSLFRLEMRLEPPVSLNSAQWATIRAVPLPSQRDEWRLYKRLEGEKIRQSQGDMKAFDWKIKEELERKERQDAQRLRNFRLSVGSMDMMYASGTRFPSVGHDTHNRTRTLTGAEDSSGSSGSSWSSGVASCKAG